MDKQTTVKSNLYAMRPSLLEVGLLNDLLWFRRVSAAGDRKMHSYIVLRPQGDIAFTQKVLNARILWDIISENLIPQALLPCYGQSDKGL